MFFESGLLGARESGPRGERGGREAGPRGERGGRESGPLGGRRSGAANSRSRGPLFCSSGGSGRSCGGLSSDGGAAAGRSRVRGGLMGGFERVISAGRP